MAAEKKNKYRSPDVSETVVEIDEQVFEKHDVSDYEAKPTERKNKPEQRSEPVIEKKPKPALKERIRQFMVVYQNERTQKIIGLLLILFSSYLGFYLAWRLVVKWVRRLN